MLKRLMNKDVLLKFGVAISIIILWGIFVKLNLFRSFLPDFSSIIKFLAKLDNLKVLFGHLMKTLSKIIPSLFIGCFLGYFLGILMGSYDFIRNILYDILNAFKSLPVTVLIPIFLTIFGLSSFIIPLLSLPLSAIMAVNISDAYKSINSNRFFLLNLVRMKKMVYWRHVVLWETLDTLFATLRILVTYIVALEVAIDYFLGINGGLGYFIYSNYRSAEYLPNMYAGIFVVFIIGISFTKLINFLSKKVMKWK